MTKAMDKTALMMGLPTVIKSDGGPCFKAGPFKELTDAYGISHVLPST